MCLMRLPCFLLKSPTQIRKGSVIAFKCCPTEEIDVDSNFTHADLMQRNWTATIDSTIAERTVAVYL